MLCSLGHVALFDSSQTWVVEHPQTLFAWEGACIWIPCTYRMPVNNANLNKILLYQKYEFDNNTKDFTGTVLYNNTEIGSSPSKHGRVTFLGNRNSNCTLEILEMRESDRGQLGLRMISGTNKWMEHIYLNISSKCTRDTAPSECMRDAAPSECTRDTAPRECMRGTALRECMWGTAPSERTWDTAPNSGTGKERGESTELHAHCEVSNPGTNGRAKYLPNRSKRPGSPNVCPPQSLSVTSTACGQQTPPTTPNSPAPIL